MLGVDRLDYTKGITHRLQAYGELLAEGKLDVEDVTLVQVANPSRERVKAYMELRDEIELTVGRINGDFATISHTAISYHHHGYPREEMVALYLAADVMLVTALRDGMNLVAKEYVACRFDEDGVLILSEFAGASDELRRALAHQPAPHRRAQGDHPAALSRCRSGTGWPRMRSLRRNVMVNDVAKWSSAFLHELMASRASRSLMTESLHELPMHRTAARTARRIARASRCGISRTRIGCSSHSTSTARWRPRWMIRSRRGRCPKRRLLC